MEITPDLEVVAQRFDIPWQVVREVDTVPLEVLRHREAQSLAVPSNAEHPFLAAPAFPVFTVRACQTADPYIDYVSAVDPDEVVPGESEGGIRNHPTFIRYVQWYRQGHLPPPPSVFEQFKGGERKLIGGNRRRILAAQAAGIRSLPVWLGRSNRETDLPLKYQDIKRALEDARNGAVRREEFGQ